MLSYVIKLAKKKRIEFDTLCSHVVTHHNTNKAYYDLTSVIGREQVLFVEDDRIRRKRGKVEVIS